MIWTSPALVVLTLAAGILSLGIPADAQSQAVWTQLTPSEPRVLVPVTLGVMSRFVSSEYLCSIR